jgi:hypothetical protein
MGTPLLSLLLLYFDFYLNHRNFFFITLFILFLYLLFHF